MSQWLKELRCRVKHLQYDYDRFVGRLWMEEENRCDMSGCIKLFKGIDPAVALIETYSGGVPDSVYRNEDGDWRAYSARPRGKSVERAVEGTKH